MNNQARGIRLAVALVMVILLLAVSPFALAADSGPIRVSSRSEPQSVISEQDVTITIKIYNSGQTDMEQEINLYDPLGQRVDTFAGLKAESSVVYTGTWRVTQEQIDQGKINYYVKYQVDGEDSASAFSIPVTIQAETAAPQLTATYSISPTSAREGQTVTVTYTLSNTGNIELRNISVKNEGISSKELTSASLSVGEKVVLTDTFTMGSKELVSQPTITYQSAEDKKTLTISDMARKTITVAEDGLEVTLSADNTEDIYPGESVTLKLEMKNSGDVAYTNLNARLEDGTVLASGVELAPGASYTNSVQWSTQEDSVLSAQVSGLDASGSAVDIVSNELAFTTQDASKALVLNVRAQAQTTTIYSEPAVIRFGVVVENIGQTDATTLTIQEANKTVATIPSLPSGESRTVVFDVEASIAGQFQFAVKGKDAVGNEKVYNSNIIEISYVEPTPAPTATPAPTDVPPTPSPAPTATPRPTLVEMITARVDPMVLYTAAGVLAVALIVILTVSGVSSAKRKKRMAGALDTIELSPDVRNHRGVRRKGKKHLDKAETSPEKKAKDETIVPTPELTEEETRREKAEASSTPARDAMRRMEQEGHRRRAAQEDQVSAEETLRVVPVDQRPEFVAQGKVDDSQTRIFGKLPAQEAPKDGAKKEAPMPEEEHAGKDASAKKEDAPAQEDAGGQTIRLGRADLDEIRQQARQDGFGVKGQTRKEIKPIKKKKKGLFGRRKEEEDDFVEAVEDSEDDDDLFE